MNGHRDTQVISQSTIIQGPHTSELSHADWSMTRAMSALKLSFTREESSEAQLSEGDLTQYRENVLIIIPHSELRPY